MNNSNWTGRTNRTLNEALGCDGHAIYAYRAPLYKRVLFGIVRHGWIAFVVALAVLVLTGCVDMDSEQRSADSLRDAVQQARVAK